MKLKKKEKADPIEQKAAERVPAADNVRAFETKRFIGKRTHIVTKEGDMLQKQRAFMNELENDGTVDELKAIMKADTEYVAGICMNFTPKGYDYWVAVEVEEETPVELGYEETAVPEGMYAHFECEGASVKAVSDCWSEVYNRWFPKSGYNHLGTQEIEIYPIGDKESEGYHCTLLVPVKAIERIPLSKYKRTGMMGGAPYMLLGSIAGVLISGTTDTKAMLIYALAGGSIAWFLYGYIVQRKEKREREEKEAKAKAEFQEALAKEKAKKAEAAANKTAPAELDGGADESDETDDAQNQ